MSSVWTIRRSRTDAKLSGLCGGIARDWGVDPVLVRVGFGLLALSGGVGIVLYLAGWLLVPQEGRDTPALDDLLGSSSQRWPRGAQVALVVVACAISFAIFSWLLPIGLGPVLILALLWYFGYYRTRSRNAAPPPPVAPPAPLAPPEPFRYPGPATPFTEAADAWRRRMEEHVQQTSRPSGAMQWAAPPAAAPASPPAGAPTASFAGSTVPDQSTAAWPAMPTAPSPVQDPPSAEDVAYAAYLTAPDPVGLYEPAAVPAKAAPSRRTQAHSRSAHRLRLVALAVLGLTLAALGIADVQGVSVPLTAYLGASLLVVGLTLVAATWLGRARGILPVGLLLVIALAGSWVASPLGTPREWNPHRTYTEVAALPAGGDRHDLGRMEIDLSGLRVTRDTAYSAHVDAGGLEVEVPDDVNLRIRYSVDQGVVFDGDEATVSGSDLTGDLPAGRRLAGRPTLTLDLSVDYGELRVRR